MTQELKPCPQPFFALSERLEHGNFAVAEVLELARVSRTKFYADAKAGLVAIDKFGAKSVVRGPIARAYIEGSNTRARR